MDKYSLPTSVEIDGVVCEFKTDFRDILKIFEALNDPDLLDTEKMIVALFLFYKNEAYKSNIEFAIKTMFNFINGGSDEDAAASTHSNNTKPLYDWEKDFSIIVAPINRVLGKDIRGLEYLHWWTFLSAFMEIGECAFSTYVSIRDKLNKGKKLEKYEERILKEHREDIILKPKVDSVTQSIMDEILGV